MADGFIIKWEYTNESLNGGTLVGCSIGVHSGFFFFNIQNVLDPVLVNLLRTQSINTKPNCDAPPAPNWVSFTPNGKIATSIFRIFL